MIVSQKLTGQVTSKLGTFYMLNNRKSLEFRYDPTSISYKLYDLFSDDEDG